MCCDYTGHMGVCQRNNSPSWWQWEVRKGFTEEVIGLTLEDEENEVGKVWAKQRSKKWQRIFVKLQYGCGIWFVGEQFRKLLHSLGEKKSSEVRYCMLTFLISSGYPELSQLNDLVEWMFNRNCCYLTFLVHGFIVTLEVYHIRVHTEIFFMSASSL